MSWTKTEHWDAICAMMGEIDEFYPLPEDEDETGIDMFSDRRLDFTGYEEFECSLCGEFADNDFGHPECFDRERAWHDRD